MKKDQIFSGIFATVFVASTTLIVSSCNQDDDYYDTDMHTLAEKRMTRSGEPGGGEGLIMFYYLNETTQSKDVDAGLELHFKASCSINMSYDLKPVGEVTYTIHNDSLIHDVRITDIQTTVAPTHTYIEVGCRLSYSRYNVEKDSLQPYNMGYVSRQFPLKSIEGSPANPPEQPAD